MDRLDNIQFLIQSTDALQNALSVYDSEARLLFANKAFRNNFKIGEQESYEGQKISDILAAKKISVINMENEAYSMKMYDVLKSGEATLDCEVRIVYGDSEAKSLVVSNDMYPVKNDHGRVIGMIELSRSYQRNLNYTRKAIGLNADYRFENVVGKSDVIKAQIRVAKEFANSPFNFMITGESGVGKEVFAQSAHNYSPRYKGPFVAVNCGSIPEELIESELFGYVGGAFTGASKHGQIGKFELADGGTLFLDEVGELPFSCQAKLLRVLETWTITRIGSSRPIPVNVRLITATNRDLRQMVQDGLFREDLYYRLQVLSLEIPPLRDRREDVILLAESFLKQSLELYSNVEKALSPEAEKVLEAYDWPGNVRELKNVINRAVVLSKSEIISGELAEQCIYSYNKALGLEKPKLEVSGNGSSVKSEPENEPVETRPLIPEKEYLLSPKSRMDIKLHAVHQANAELIREAIDIAEGNKTKAAKILDVSRKTLYRMIEKYCPELL